MPMAKNLLCQFWRLLDAYETPEVVVPPLADGLPGYSAWIDYVTRGHSPSEGAEERST